MCGHRTEPAPAWDALTGVHCTGVRPPGSPRTLLHCRPGHGWRVWGHTRLGSSSWSWGQGWQSGELACAWPCGLSVGTRGVGLLAEAAQLRSQLLRSERVLTLFLVLNFTLVPFYPFTLRLKQERELVLTQLSQGLATELTELVVTECVRETCSQELK